MSVLEIINQRVEAEFKEIWGINDYSGALALCNKIRREINTQPYSSGKFDEGYQYRVIFHPDLEVAKDEFVNLVFGWW